MNWTVLRAGAPLIAVACGRVGFDRTGDGDSGVDARPFQGTRRAYLKASTPGMGDAFGGRVALAGDGSRIAISAMGQASSSGAAYVFVRSGDQWLEEARLTASNAEVGDQLGRHLAISAAGDTIAVSANLEDGSDVNNPASNALMDSGAAYVFVRTGTSWTQQAYLKGSVVAPGDDFGTSLALTPDGNTLVVGSYASIGGAGAVYIFQRVGTQWSQIKQLTASNLEAGDRFGEEVAISSDGSWIAVGAPLEDSIATGIDGDELDNSAIEAGAVYLFESAGGTWPQRHYLKASNTALSDPMGSYEQFGWSVSLSANGDTLAVGARLEGSSATGVGANQNDNSAPSSGAAYLFTREGTVWSQQEYIKLPNVTTGDFAFETVRLSADGNSLVVTAPLEDGSGIGIDPPIDEAAMDAGAVFRYTRSGTAWMLASYLKALNTGAGDQVSAAAISADGGTIAIGAFAEDSDGTSQADNSRMDSGAVYVYWD